jgi:hypothetical protein
MTPDPETETTNIAPVGEYDAFKAARKDHKPIPALGVTPEPEEPAVPEPVKKAEAKTWEPWTDPETGETFKEPSRRAQRIRTLHDQREQEKAARLKAEAELAELKARPTREPEPEPEPSDPKVAKAHADELTAAAEKRIRPKPDRTKIGTEAYPTYEDYIDDMALWGGELATEKRMIQAELAQETRQRTDAQTKYSQSVQAAKAAHADYEAVVARDLPINQVIWDIVTTDEQGGEILYQLASQPTELARIAALPAEKSAVELGKFLAKAEPLKSTKADYKAPEPKAPKLAEPITPVVSGAGKGNPVDLADIAETGNYEEFRRVRQEQIKQYGRR